MRLIFYSKYKPKLSSQDKRNKLKGVSGENQPSSKEEIKPDPPEEEEIKDDYNFENVEAAEVPENTTTENETPPVEEKAPRSPMLDPKMREKLLNLGESLDSKQLADALGYIDLRFLLR